MTAPDIEQTLVPKEAAKFLGISIYKLARLRREKRIHGEQVGTSNIYVYRLSDLRKVDLTPRTRGPKPKNIAQN